MPKNNSALGLFFRIPEYGKVKKRLANEIGNEEALKIYITMLNDTILNVKRLRHIDLFGFYDGKIEDIPDAFNAKSSLEILFSRHKHPQPLCIQQNYLNAMLRLPNPCRIKIYEHGAQHCMTKVFQDKGLSGIYVCPFKTTRIFWVKGICCIPQHGASLGERMFNAIKHLLDAGYKNAALIGSDSPDLPNEYIEEAFVKLNSFELVLGPCKDGGYYLIGMKKPSDVIFKDMKWGSETVLHDTIVKALQEGIDYFLLPKWYDIDDAVSLNQWLIKSKFENS